MIDELHIKAAAANEKLNILLEAALRAGAATAVRVDPQSHMALRALRDQLSGLPAIYPTEDGDRWQDLPVVIEINHRHPEASILTIEGLDGGSGRVRYFNWPENPEGYQ